MNSIWKNLHVLRKNLFYVLYFMLMNIILLRYHRGWVGVILIKL